MCMCNKAVVYRFVDEVMNAGHTEILGELVDADHVLHNLDGDLYGPEGVRIAVTELRTGFPDLQMVVNDMVAEGDWVVRRFVLKGTHTGPYLGMPGSGRTVEVQGVGLDRVNDGRMVESWISLDAFGLARQLGYAEP